MKTRAAAVVLLGLAVAALAWLLAAVWPFTVDDAFITFRYARHLAAGAGPLYNPGLPPAEGNTTFLWMLVMVVPQWLGLDPVGFAKVTGAAAMLLAVLLAMRLAARLAGDSAAPLAAAAAALLIAAFPPTAVHAVSGMETALFAWLAVALCGKSLDLIASPTQSNAAWCAILALLLGLTRPEGNLLAAAQLGGALLLVEAHARAGVVRAWLLWLVLPGAAYFAWRWKYYGHFLPLPFYLKVTAPHGLAGLANVAAFARAMGALGLLALPALWTRPRRALPPLLPVAALMAFYVVPAHIMGFHWRYLFPAVPLLAALAGAGLAAGVALAARRASALARGAVWMAAGIAVVVAASLAADAPRVIALRQAYAHGLGAAHVTLGKRLSSCARDLRPAPRLAIADAGAVPYYSGWRTFDTYGLNEPRIALTGSRDPEIVLRDSPDVVVLVSARPDSFVTVGWNGWEPDLLQACQGRGYERAAALAFQPDYWLWVLVRPGSAVQRCFGAGQLRERRAEAAAPRDRR